MHLEHVVRREELVESLFRAGDLEEVRYVLSRAETCVVTRQEHAQLGRGSGWERYADIEIVDGPHAPEDESSH